MCFEHIMVGSKDESLCTFVNWGISWLITTTLYKASSWYDEVHTLPTLQCLHWIDSRLQVQVHQVDTSGAAMSCYALIFVCWSLLFFPGIISPKTATLGSARECWQETPTTEVETTTFSHVFIDPSIHLRPGVDVDLPSASGLCK